MGAAVFLIIKGQLRQPPAGDFINPCPAFITGDSNAALLPKLFDSFPDGHPRNGIYLQDVGDGQVLASERMQYFVFGHDICSFIVFLPAGGPGLHPSKSPPQNGRDV